MAPEAARGNVEHASDIWSVGVTFIEMVTGMRPWAWKGSEAAFIAQLGKDETLVPAIPADLPDEADEFLQSCFQRDPSKRPTAHQLLQMSFLTS
jgi:mitogen-activated protein kinase kinase kinase 3